MSRLFLHHPSNSYSLDSRSFLNPSLFLVFFEDTSGFQGIQDLKSWFSNYQKYFSIISRTRIYPGTTQILLTINVNTWLQSRELLMPLPLGPISLAIDVNTDTSKQSINGSTRTQSTQLHYNPVNYQRHCHWARSRKLSMSQLGHNPQPVYQNREWLLSHSKLYGVSLSTSCISSVYSRLWSLKSYPLWVTL